MYLRRHSSTFGISVTYLVLNYPLISDESIDYLEMGIERTTKLAHSRPEVSPLLEFLLT